MTEQETMKTIGQRLAPLFMAAAKDPEFQKRFKEWQEAWKAEKGIKTEKGSEGNEDEQA